MSLKEWADSHGEDYPSRFRRETSTKPPTIKDLQFCFDELLASLGWDDEIAETGVDPLAWARNEIKDLHKQKRIIALENALAISTDMLEYLDGDDQVSRSELDEQVQSNRALLRK